MSKEWFLDSSTTMWIPYIHLTLTVTPATRRWGLAALHVLSLATAKATTKNCILIFFLLIWIGQMKKDLQKKKKKKLDKLIQSTHQYTHQHTLYIRHIQNAHQKHKKSFSSTNFKMNIKINLYLSQIRFNFISQTT